MNRHLQWNPDEEGYEIKLNDIDYESPSIAISMSVMALSGENEKEIPPLWESVDPSALDRFLDDTTNRSSTDRRVLFYYNGFEIEMRNQQEILLRPRDTNT